MERTQAPFEPLDERKTSLEVANYLRVPIRLPIGHKQGHMTRNLTHARKFVTHAKKNLL